LVLARATHDQALSDELLASVRETLGERAAKATPRRARREPPRD
jgi:hypothetical protein